MIMRWMEEYSFFNLIRATHIYPVLSSATFTGSGEVPLLGLEDPLFFSCCSFSEVAGIDRRRQQEPSMIRVAILYINRGIEWNLGDPALVYIEQVIVAVSQHFINCLCLWSAGGAQTSGNPASDVETEKETVTFMSARKTVYLVS